MGREKVLHTYGHHRKRFVCVETDNIFESPENCRDHVFSTSSSESGFGPSDRSVGSVDVSFHAKKKGRRARRNAPRTGKDENVDTQNKKRKRTPRRRPILFSSDKDTSSSAGSSEYSTPGPARKRINRRALHDVGNECQKGKRKCPPAKQTATASKTPVTRKQCSINFSEFDDYSLVISDSPLDKGGKAKVDEGVGTSTPCYTVAGRLRPRIAELQAVDISVIEGGVDVGDSDARSPSLAISVSTPSRLHPVNENSDCLFSESSLHGNDNVATSDCSDQKNLERLEESFASLRVGGRKLRKQKEKQQKPSPCSEISPAVVVSNGVYHDSSDDDRLALECKIRVQKLKVSLIKSAAVSENCSLSFDASQSLFDSPCGLPEEEKLPERKSKAKRPEDKAGETDSDDSKWESEALDDEDLSAIVEDGEEEDDVEEEEEEEAGEEVVKEEEEEELEEDEDEEDDSVEEDENDSESESQEVTPVLDCSAMDSSNVRYMLTSSFSSTSEKVHEESLSSSDLKEEEEEDTVEEDDSPEEVETESSPLDGSHSRYILASSFSSASEKVPEDSLSNSDLKEEDEDTVEEDESPEEVETESPPVDISGSRYMLTSLSCADNDLLEERSFDADSSILDQSKKSLGANLSRSFAEILTPSKAINESGKELSSRDKVLEQCGQDEPLSFKDVIPLSALKKCVKIGEGVYGEVFRTKHRGQSVALKIIPIEGDFEVNDERQKTFEEILPEIVISNELSGLRKEEENNTANFCTVKSVSLVQGRYPPELLKQWDIFHEKKKSENDRPDVFNKDQLYIMFEFGDGGTDLDGFKLQNGDQAISILQQTACALAVAEEVLQFEHRDLHIGNILVQPTESATVTMTLHGSPIFMDTQGIHVSIIDFTLSRLTKDGCTVFCNLATDDTLFEGKGDYQFDIYRMMQKENKNNWRRYHPYTNVMWLHYLCDKLLHGKRYAVNDRDHRDSLKRLRQVYNNLLDYGSAAHFVLENDLFTS